MNETASPNPDRSIRVRQFLLLLCLFLLAAALVVDFVLTREYALQRGGIWLVALAASGGLFLLARKRRVEQTRLDAPVYQVVAPGDHDDTANEAAIVSELTHALRTPLTAIQGFSELLNTRSPSESMRQEWLSVLDIEAQRMQAVLERAQDLVRLREGKVRLRQETVFLYSWLSKALGPQDAEDGITIEFPADMPGPAVSIDSPRFRQTLLLLVEDISANLPESKIALELEDGCAGSDAYHFGTPVCPAGASLRIVARGKSADANGYSMPETPLQLEPLANGGVSLGGIDLGIARETLALHGASLWIAGDVTRGFGVCMPLVESPVSETPERERKR